MKYWICTRLYLFLLFLGLGQLSWAQLSDKIEDFTLNHVLDNRPVSLSSFEESPCVVIIFVAHYCPYVKSYRQRIIDLVQRYGGDKHEVKFMLINPQSGQDKLESIKKNAAAFNCPYLIDTELKITKRFQATRLPEAFVLQPSLGHFIVKYHGAIDDNPQNAAEVKGNYLEETIQAILNNKNPSLSNPKPTGCSIKY